MVSLKRAGQFFDRWKKSAEQKEEAPVGVEPTMADLQSAALATWLRRLIFVF